MTVYAATAWRTNGELIEDVARLGYIGAADRVLDPTYGLGRWWTNYRPVFVAAVTGSTPCEHLLELTGPRTAA